jgi:hypothetical protein
MVWAGSTDRTPEGKAGDLWIEISSLKICCDRATYKIDLRSPVGAGAKCTAENINLSFICIYGFVKMLKWSTMF